MVKSLRFLFLVLILSLSVGIGISVAQVNAVRLQCGDIKRDEIPSSEARLGLTYLINLKAGDKLTVRVVSVSDKFSTWNNILDPNNRVYSTFETRQRENQVVDLEVPASGDQKIVIVGSDWSIGAYTLYIGCKLLDGTLVNPGDIPFDASNATGDSALSTATPTFSGNGFPGLASVDFSSVANIPVVANIPMTGGVAPDGSTILGYTVDAKANDTLALNFTRLSGNLNLGLVVLSADNKVVFQASLITSSELTTKFTLPSDGTYTIGIFRIDLLPPAAPEATAFQLTATVNP